jgi:hypothetical protein
VSRETFKTRKSRILKGITISLAVLLSIGLVFGLVYARFGIAGFAKLLGLDKQEIIATGTVEKTEIESIHETLGYDPAQSDTANMTGRQRVDMALSRPGWPMSSTR